VIEEFMAGEEASFFVLCDGTDCLPIGTAQDHKRVGDGDTGPNTGGMGAYSPAPVVTPAVRERVMREIIGPTLEGLRKDGVDYTGFLYAGLMIDGNGVAKVLEFNCRLGDPETQPLMMRLKSDVVDLFDAALDRRLDQARAEWDARPALGVVMAAAGYPGSYRKRDEIHGLAAAAGADLKPDLKVFHAGTALDPAPHVITTGGRVLCVCALGDTVAAAQARAYEGVAKIRWEGVQYRRDIGYRAINR
jgi:phosphoribosylamine--glycine ligase